MPSHKQKLSTNSLEESGELVPSREWEEDEDSRVPSLYGSVLSETTTTHTTFENGELVTIVRDGLMVLSQFFGSLEKGGETEKE